MNIKRPYIKPLIMLNVIELECGIASGSAQVLVDDTNMDLFEEWNQEEDERRIIDWM
ncbi:hypothetical protein [Sphingobacterium bovistauri]|uniref:Uncharacterized protein n=1 Tax=Sphingobacterium bovistauri TaxID=2781959 RepID=A0ABS7Z872_9SPHI|nr:hypothetical protein [Sphingobacterium bovistauri]MCA5006183.1 hypothetical protein [Sphingobacterium bovistauri]